VEFESSDLSTDDETDWMTKTIVQKLTAVDLFERVSVDNPYMVQMKLSEAESEELRNLREDLGSRT
jgi:hypothetical protein